MPNIGKRETWQSALANHFELEYASRPLPTREQFSLSQEFQCRILGGTLISWLQRHGPTLLREREFLRDMMGVESNPTIILISNSPGLVAAHEILDPKSDSIFYFSSEVFAAFRTAHPDDDFRWHVEYSSFFAESLKAEDFDRASQHYPLQPKEQFWLHRESSTLGRLFGRGGDHLWKWNG